jgi:hypothetical protein
MIKLLRKFSSHILSSICFLDLERHKKMDDATQLIKRLRFLKTRVILFLTEEFSR